MLRADTHRPWIVLCHGMGTNRSNLLHVAVGLLRAGFNLLAFDFRGHGTSEGRSTSFGWREQRDLEGALAFLGRQTEIPARPYGVYGLSMGGAVALMTAARDERLRAIAIDSPYADLGESLKHHLRLLYHAPSIPFFWFVASVYRLRFGAWPHHVSPQLAARSLRKHQALLVIQGDQDPRVPLEQTRRLMRDATPSNELWMVQGAAHLGAYEHDPHAYLAKLEQFFTAHLW